MLAILFEVLKTTEIYHQAIHAGRVLILFKTHRLQKCFYANYDFSFLNPKIPAGNCMGLVIFLILLYLFSVNYIVVNQLLCKLHKRNLKV